MQVLYDHQAFAFQKYGGISRYHAKIIQELRQKGMAAYLPEDMYHANVYLDQYLDKNPNPIFGIQGDFKGKKLLQFVLGRKFSMRSIDKLNGSAVFHPTFYDPYFLTKLEKRKLPFVITVHDLTHEKFGLPTPMLSIDYYVRKGQRLLCERADAIVCVSQNTKNDLISLYPELGSKRIEVIYHGNTLQLPQSTDNPSSIFTGDYVLYLGSRSGYKNFQSIIPAMGRLLRENRDLHLLCSGGSEFTEEEMALFEKESIQHQVKRQLFKNDHELALLYNQALFFIFPSAYEGFGIPILEAFACECPVLLSNSSCFPEIAQDAAIFFEENDSDSCYEQAKQLLHNNGLRAEMKAKGKERLQDFSWEKSASEHWALYESLNVG
ncbi:MAG: glycosyltransferase family 1 protein [Saprospiraceae bacterium]